MSDLILESIRGAVLASVVVYLWRAGEKRADLSRGGWHLILGGFVLLLFGSVLDVSDNFPSLNRFVIVGETEAEAFLEKMVGFLGGFILIAAGLVRWIPTIAGVEKSQRLLEELTQTNAELADANGRLEREVSERKRAVHALRENEGLLAATIESTADGILVADGRGHVVLANARFAEMWNIPQELLALKDEKALLDHVVGQLEEPQQFLSKIEGLYRTRAEDLDTLRFLDGRVFERYSCPLLGGGQLAGRVWSFRDVTVRALDERKLKEHAQALESANQNLKQLREMAEAATQAKSEFLANMSHEIRTPMTAILGYADLLTEAGLTEKQRAGHLNTIRRNGEVLLDVINDVLDLSKIEAGKMTVERTQCSPCRIVNDVVSLMRVRAEGKGLSLETDFVFPLPATIQTDPVRLRQILTNLVGNAIKFTEQGTVRVAVRCRRDPDARPRLHFAVDDTGIGMAPRQITGLFQPFNQADTSTTRRFGGTGLGLTISKRLANALGGDIRVKTQLGRGSTFTVAIDPGPLDGVRMLDAISEDSDGEREPTNNNDIPVLGGRALLAEDGPDNQRLIRFFLTKAGLEVDVAENGRAAYEKALASKSEGRPYDVILMDMQMPEWDGYEATRRLREGGWRGPIIALTAHAMAGSREKCLETGCDDFATKPIDRARFFAVVGRHLGKVEDEARAFRATTGRSRFRPPDRS